MARGGSDGRIGDDVASDTDEVEGRGGYTQRCIIVVIVVLIVHNCDRGHVNGLSRHRKAWLRPLLTYCTSICTMFSCLFDVNRICVDHIK